MPIIDHFGIIAPYYNRIFKVQEPKRLIEHLNLHNVGTLLDAGGGTGRVSEKLIGLTSEIIVLDNSYKMLEQGNKERKLIFIQSQTETLPFKDNSLERIVMVDAFHHVHNQEKTIQEFWRIIKPDGVIVIEEPDIHTFAVKLIALGEKILMMRSHFVEPEGIAQMFKSLGASVLVDRNSSIAWIVVRKGKH